jgi:hypothetical protein
MNKIVNWLSFISSNYPTENGANNDKSNSTASAVTAKSAESLNLTIAALRFPILPGLCN